MPAPTFDHDLSFAERVKYLPVQQLVSEPGIEALDITVLPWTARRDVGRLRANSGNPSLNRLSDKLWAIVGTNVSRYATLDKQLAQYIDHVDRLQLAPNPDC